MKNTVKSYRYQPNVSAFLSLCGRNYAHILHWLPSDAQQGLQWRIEGGFGVLDIALLENTPYTQLVRIARPTGKSGLIPVPNVLVRVYHDAKLAEVLTGQQISQLQAVYDYPNLRMYQRDEKYQVNAFLEELLKIGRRATRVCLS
ncbi:DUF1249 domain-containing protein [Shewanella sp. NFH-SH190041]|uniref:DUF1249 domain-containing protein n=1 Tax=Shewanella sp. NFH-SH190041 TaxID=2950245 RepID=UPI0021C2C494|nr:DUF1249 domain-containing protein [Shewanella sp. NFH-SH190041]BDM65798.1 DUF1249 domain-containing protein [Shewanella sp. NFH-SH190041]